MRKLIFQDNHYYHIYNRGVDKRRILLDTRDYVRFIKNMRWLNNDISHKQRVYLKNKSTQELSSEASELSSALESFIYSQPKPVDFICYSILPNHYHLLIKQNNTNGISRFMHKLSLGYTNYFNTKYNRSGSLFQGTYKAIEVKSDEHLIYLSAYINANSRIHGISDNSDIYPWCGYPDYLNQRNGTLCNKQIILGRFQNIDSYKKFVNDNALNVCKDKKFQKLFFDN